MSNNIKYIIKLHIEINWNITMKLYKLYIGDTNIIYIFLSIIKRFLARMMYDQAKLEFDVQNSFKVQIYDHNFLFDFLRA